MLFMRNRWLFWYLELTISPSLTGVYVENLSEFVVRSPVEVLSLLAVGRKRLVFAETKMNRNSSRFGSNIFFFTKLLFILYYTILLLFISFGLIVFRLNVYF